MSTQSNFSSFQEIRDKLFSGIFLDDDDLYFLKDCSVIERVTLAKSIYRYFETKHLGREVKNVLCQSFISYEIGFYEAQILLRAAPNEILSFAIYNPSFPLFHLFDDSFFTESYLKENEMIARARNFVLRQNRNDEVMSYIRSLVEDEGASTSSLTDKQILRVTGYTDLKISLIPA